MDWTMPDRPRRLVTYGKLAHNRTERKQRAQTNQTPEEKHGSGLTAEQSKISSPSSSRESVGDTAPERRDFVESPSQRSRPNNRSPKRRKLSPKGDDEISPISSPRPRTRRGAATQTTYARSK
jgi:hypothetical protein